MSASNPTTVPLPAVPLAPPVQHDGSLSVDATENGESPKRSLRLSDERVPAWLVSMIVHTLLLILLAFLSFRESVGRVMTLKLSFANPVEASDRALEVFELVDPNRVDNSQASEQPNDVAVAVPRPAATSSPFPSKTPAPISVSAIAAQLLQGDQQNAAHPLPTGGGLGGRSPAGRQEWGQRLGATPESEAAVELALRWLADHQRNDGSWSFDLTAAPCDGRCQNPRHNPNRLPAPPTAATGLALLAFLGAGYTHQAGPYAEEVERGLYYLRGQMRPADFGSDLQLGSMYGHGIATLAVTEAAAMTDDDDLREMAGDLTRFILAARHPDGSWGYTPGAPGDITLTGWQVMALKGAHRLDISMPTDVFTRTKRYVDSLSPDDGMHFGYRKPEEAKTPTAIGLTLQLYLGRSPKYTKQHRGLGQLFEWGPTYKNVYHDYYATLAMHHSGDPLWDQWHPKVRDHLVQSQATTGHERGSWHFRDHFGDVGGRLYTTAMAAMMLEVYYRYLPLYAEAPEFPL